MIAVCADGGLVATVLPHGVLFRGGEEKGIREGIINDDLLEAVIGIAPNLFYGTGIPACILILRKQKHGCKRSVPKPPSVKVRYCLLMPTVSFLKGARKII